MPIIAGEGHRHCHDMGFSVSDLEDVLHKAAQQAHASKRRDAVSAAIGELRGDSTTAVEIYAPMRELGKGGSARSGLLSSAVKRLNITMTPSHGFHHSPLSFHTFQVAELAKT